MLFLALPIAAAVGCVGAVMLSRIRTAGLSVSRPQKRAAGTLSIGGWAPLVVHVALVSVVLYLASLCLRSYLAADHADLGVDARGLYAMPLRGTDAAAHGERAFAVAQEIALQPGIESVTWGRLPLSGGWTAVSVYADPPMTVEELTRRERNGDEWRVSANYFAVVGIEVIAGRTFDSGRDLPGTTILSAGLARSLDVEPGGQVFVNGTHPSRVVGIAEDVKVDGPERSARPVVYRLGVPPMTTLIIRSRADAVIGHVLRAYASDLAVPGGMAAVVSGRDVRDRLLLRQRSRAILIGSLSVMGLLLAIVSIGHLLAAHGRRSLRNAAVRSALGAKPTTIALNVFLDIAKPAIAGMILGVAIGTALGAILSSLLFSVASFDITSVAGTIGAVAIVVALAAAPCMFMAARANPLILLRLE
jgi:hypothetical protein